MMCVHVYVGGSPVCQYWQPDSMEEVYVAHEALVVFHSQVYLYFMHITQSLVHVEFLVNTVYVRFRNGPFNSFTQTLVG